MKNKKRSKAEISRIKKKIQNKNYKQAKKDSQKIIESKKRTLRKVKIDEKFSKDLEVYLRKVKSSCVKFLDCLDKKSEKVIPTLKPSFFS